MRSQSRATAAAMPEAAPVTRADLRIMVAALLSSAAA